MSEVPDYKKLKAINPSLTEQTARYLLRLKRSGLHGSTVSEVARTLIQDQIKALIREGALKMEFDPSDGDDD